MSNDVSYDARVYKTEVYKGSRVTTYKVRWKVGHRHWKEAFRTAAQADSFRSALLTAARKGEAFSLATGRPTAWERTRAETSWYEFACRYVDMKWKLASAKYRKDIARALTAATPALLAAGRARPDDAAIRRALLRYCFNTKQRPNPPDDVAEVLAWISQTSLPVAELAEASVTRRVLEHATGRLDGRNAAASTARRHRTILANAMDYAIELGLLDSNPIRALKWTAPKVSSQVDRRSVVNPQQARALLEGVRAQQPSGPRLVAFFAVMYYAGLRPEEAINLRADDIVLPPQARQDAQDAGEWGELHLRSATPDAGSEWTDDGSARERRQLKHRAEGDSRIVPVHPELTILLRDHLDRFATAPDGRLFSGVRGGELPTITYRRAWTKARQTALTAAEQAYPLARRPYDLRHACLSTWLNGGVYPTQVAEWAGHSVDVLLRIYAKCVVGQDELAKRRISEALRQV
ncbi:MAG: site-specific integrase [Actinobacteria bacterium]|nr:site-specific integrase [Actinomycetota bacterium]